MIKRMNKKQWYDTLDKYSKLATQRKNVIEEYGIQYWDKEKELTQIQDNLLQQRNIFKNEFDTLYKYSLFFTDSYPFLSEHETLIDAIFVLIENLEPIPKEVYRNSFVKAKIVLHPDMIYALFSGIALIYLILDWLYK